MEIDLNLRKNQLAQLGRFISYAKNQFDSILVSLDWSEDKLKENHENCACPHNAHHLISQKTAAEHARTCSVKSSGYNLNEQFLSEPLNTSCSIKIDHATKVQILSKARSIQHDFKAVWDGKNDEPMTSPRLTSTFTSDERLALYNYCIQNTEKPSVPDEVPLFSDDKQENKSLTFEEKLALERDAKRRRIKYKSVHTKRKSHTEVMREVIENQMELYKDWMDRQNKSKTTQNGDGTKDNNEKPSSLISRHSNDSRDKDSKHHSSRICSRDRDDKYSRERRRSNHRDRRRSRDRNNHRRGRSRSKNRERSGDRRVRSKNSDYDNKYNRRR